jgi:hypothetical protein
VNDLWKRLTDRGTPCPHGHIAGATYCEKCIRECEAELKEMERDPQHQS